MSKEFHITAIPCPSNSKELNIDEEIRLIKASLLYADKVLLFSIIPVIFCSIPYRIEQFSKDREMQQKIENIKSDMLKELSCVVKENKELKSKLDEIQEYLKNKNTDFESLFKEEINKSLGRLYNIFLSAMNEVTSEIGINKLGPAIKSGLLDVYIIGKSKIPEKTYPLLDENALNLVKANIKEGKLNISDVDSEKIKQIGFVFDIFQRLPNFENATIDEILDIRKTLGKPLIRFRSAIIEMSDCIRYKPWDEGFYYDVEKLFYHRIEPAVLEIEEECKLNKYLSKLLYSATKSSWEIPAGLGVIISKLAEVSNISATAIGLAIGAGTIAYKALHEWKEKTKEIETNQMFFYYKVGELIRK
jgi:hypothetical protein